MDLSLRGKTALVCGASQGLGYACAAALAAEGVEVTLVARTPSTLAHAAQTLRETYGVCVHAIAADITSEAGRSVVLAQCPQPDILVTNAGGPPPGNYQNWSRQDWLAALEANMLTPIELMKAIVPTMQRKGWGRVINITSSAVKAPLDVLGLSNGARSGLTGFVAGLARAVAQDGVTINNLLPGPFSTARLEKTMQSWAQKDGVTVEQAKAARRTQNPTRRFGDPAEFGAFCAFIASSHAGYMTGQNLLIDGGAYPGTF